MMKVILGTLSGIALIAFTYLCVTVAIAVHTFERNASATLAQASASITRVNVALDKINAPGGLLQVTGKTVAKADNLIGHADILVNDEQRALVDWNAQISVVLDNVNTATREVTEDSSAVSRQTVSTMQKTSETIEDLQPVIFNLNIEAQDLQTATNGLTAMLPDIQDTAKNVKGVTKNLQDSTAEVKQGIHDYFHPTWAQKIWGTTLDVAGHILSPW